MLVKDILPGTMAVCVAYALSLGRSAGGHASRGVLVVLLLVAIPFALYGHALLPGRVLAPVDVLMTAYPWRALAPNVSPANPLLTDVTYLVHPLLLWGAREVGEGRLPLWNPHIFAGAPYLANPHTAVFFPLTWLLWLLPAAPALTLLAIAKLALVGVSMYWCGRVLALDRGAALLGAVAFMLSGPVVVWLHWPYTTTMTFLPLLIGLVERLRGRADVRPVAWLALAVAFDLFAGYPQGAAWSLLTAGVWALARAREAAGGAPRFLARFTAGVVLGSLAAAVQVLPFLEYARQSAVVAYREQWMPYLALPGRAAITFLIPFFFGGIRDFRGDWNFNAVTLTVGLVPWVVLPLALVVAGRATATRVLAGLALVSAAIVYGVPWIGPGLAALPVIGWGQSLRVAPVLSFAVAVLGAIGVHTITRVAPDARQRAALAVAGGAVVLTAIAFTVFAAHPELLFRAGRWSGAQHFAAFLVALTVAALVTQRWLRCPHERFRWTVALLAIEIATLAPVAASVNVAGSSAWLYPEPPVIAPLRGATAADHGRVLLGHHNIAMLSGLSDPTGHDGMTPVHFEAIAGPLGTARTIGNVGSEPLGAGAVFSSGALDVLGVRWFVVPPQAGPPRPDATLRYDAPDARVYDNPRAMPRAFLAPAARCVDDRTSRDLVRGGLAWSTSLVLTGDCTSAPAGASGSVDGAATIREDTSDRVRVDVVSATPAYLVLTDTWFPGWRATVDGVEQTIYRAHHAFRAVWVPAGAHTVEFRYRPASVTAGAVVSLLALGAIAGVLLVGARRARIAVGAGLAGLAIAPALASALESMPFTLDVPGHVRAQDTVRVTVTGRGTATSLAPAPAATPVDLYLVWAFRPDARYLAPDGTWSTEPVPLRRGVVPWARTPMTIDWRAEAVGSISLALVAVEAGGHPVDRARWVWSPELRWVTVRTPWSLDERARPTLALVGLASVVSAAILLAYARRP